MSDSEQKRVASPFIRFSKVQRKILKEENPKLGFGETSRLVGIKWKELPPDEKQVYFDEYDHDMKEQKKTMKKHKKTKSKKSKTKKSSTGSASGIAKQSQKFPDHGLHHHHVIPTEDLDAINMDNYYVSEWHPNPRHSMQAEYPPWPANMYPHLFQQSVMNQQSVPSDALLQMPAVHPVSSPVPSYLQHSGDIDAASGSTAFPDPNLTFHVDGNSNITSTETTSSSSNVMPIPTGIYTSEYYEEIASKTGVPDVKQEENSTSNPNNLSETEVIEIE